MSGSFAEVKLSPYEAGNDLNLSEGWVYCKIGDVLKVNYGKGLKEVNRNPGNTSVYGSNGIVGQHNIALTKGPTIIIGRKGSVGAVHFSKEPCWPIDTTYFIDELGELSPIYLLHVLRSLTLCDLDTSTAIPGLNRNDLYDQTIPLPPLPEQKRIVTKVEELLARVNAAKEHLAKVTVILKRFRQAVLVAACSGRLTAEWRAVNSRIEFASQRLEIVLNERRRKWESGELFKKKPRDVLHKKSKQKYREPSKPILTDLPIIDKTWTWATMDQLTTHEPNAITDGPFGSNPKTEHYREAGPRVIRLQNIGDGVFIDEYAHISPEHFTRLSKHCIFPGDVAIAALGDPVPRACIIPSSVGPAIVKADCIRFHPHPALADCSYVAYALNDQATRSRMTEVVHGVGRARLNLGEIKAIPIRLPPLMEQQEIVQRVEALLKLANSIEERLTVAASRANKLTQAILAKAFHGELVPTEADLARREGRSYEPASALLARIKAEPPEKGTNLKLQPRPKKGLTKSIN
jgi:type I restriction enzyme S subunit